MRSNRKKFRLELEYLSAFLVSYVLHQKQREQHGDKKDRGRHSQGNAFLIFKSAYIHTENSNDFSRFGVGYGHKRRYPIAPAVAKWPLKTWQCGHKDFFKHVTRFFICLSGRRLIASNSSGINIKEKLTFTFPGKVNIRNILVHLFHFSKPSFQALIKRILE